MSPLKIKILLHYYVTYDDYPDMFPSRPTEFNELTDLHLIEPRLATDDNSALWELTNRGRAYCEFLTSLPLPVMVQHYAIDPKQMDSFARLKFVPKG